MLLEIEVKAFLKLYFKIKNWTCLTFSVFFMSVDLSSRYVVIVSGVQGEAVKLWLHSLCTAYAIRYGQIGVLIKWGIDIGIEVGALQSTQFRIKEGYPERDTVAERYFSFIIEDLPPLRYIRLNCNEIHYSILHYTTLHSTTLHYTALHTTELHYFKLHYTTPHYTTLLLYTTIKYTSQN